MYNSIRLVSRVSKPKDHPQRERAQTVVTKENVCMEAVVCLEAIAKKDPQLDRPYNYKSSGHENARQCRPSSHRNNGIHTNKEKKI